MKTGNVYKIRFFERAHKKYCAIRTDSGAPYPGFDLMDIPVRCVGNYPAFYVVEVLDHVLPCAFLKNNEWKPYRVTLDKFEEGKLYQIKGV